MPPRQPSDLLDVSTWRSITPGTGRLTLSATRRARRPALRLDFDFRDGSGYVIAHRDWCRRMPEAYTLRLHLRGEGRLNDLEIKFADRGGHNVWRHVLHDLQLPAHWRRIEIPSRALPFAWGPDSGAPLEEIGSLEFAVVAGEGGRGSLSIADIELIDETARAAPRPTSSSGRASADAARRDTFGWHPQGDDPAPWLALDAHAPRDIGGLILEWQDTAPARGFRVRASNSGTRYRTVYETRRAGGRRSYVALRALRARWLRIELHGPSSGAQLALQSFEFSRSPEAFWQQLARHEPRGWHPRWLHREQAPWTPSGTAHGRDCALLSIDGIVEPHRGAWSLEPMLWLGDRLHTWAEVQTRPALRDGWKPQPSVTWTLENWRLHIALDVDDQGSPRVTYRYEHDDPAAPEARLFVLLRPFQLMPPWQQYDGIGGVRPIHALRWRDGAVEIDGLSSVRPLRSPSGFGAQGFAEGPLAGQLAGGELPPRRSVDDPAGFATGALRFDLSPRGATSCITLLCPSPQAVDAATTRPAFDWATPFDSVHWSAPGWGRDVLGTMRTAASHILVTRSGAALQPGPRRYTRAWIRDGAAMGAALLRMGCSAPVREFIDWYAPYQREDGFVPCCVDRHGPDWLVEHDSHGELVALIADHFRFSGDAAALARHWPHLERALACIENLLDDSGLLPRSASHEGYLGNPVHAYWDDFWALRALRDGAALARQHGLAPAALHWQALHDRLAAALLASIRTTRATHRIDYVPGSVEQHDLDPTATADGISRLELPPGLDRGPVDRTFDRYLENWRARRAGTAAWTNYTPYEIRIIGALLRLGRREDALELLRYFLDQRQPPAWHQWPEIVWREPAAPAHLGDLPHTWIAAEYVLAVRALFVYESEAEDALVLGAGLAPEWLEGDGVQVRGAPTMAGRLHYTLRRVDQRTLHFEIADGVHCALLLRPPLDGRRILAVDAEAGTVLHVDAQSLRIAAAPARLRLHLAPKDLT
ncbi:discoidin domain-containing protein [Solimonas soli]|uniref:discoidin domain-containing protein n=1 Tax=Solimonas soli TaxID=413479 RepID=UPI0004AD6923|nr:discoidin domain-containing protein [Solimonas soli]